MNWRWYFTGLIIALTYFGISKEQFTIPNQEIIVQFSGNSISAGEAERAISDITSRLNTIGVAEIEVSELHNVKLKVTYYSTIDVAVIKNLLSKENRLDFGHTAFNEKEDSDKSPFSKDFHTYKLDIIKIHTDFNYNTGLQGLPVATKFVKDQYLNQNVSLGISGFELSLKYNFENITPNNYRNISLLSDNSSHKIPEVRAGPVS